MSLPDIISGAFWMLLRHARPFFTIAVFIGFLAALDRLLEGGLAHAWRLDRAPSDSNGSDGLKLTAFLMIAWLAATLLTFVADALLVPATIEAILGRNPRVTGSLASCLVTLPSVLLAWLVVGLTTAVLVFSVLGIPLAIFLYVRWSFVVQVICRDRTSAIEALRRSTALVQGRWWRTAIVLASIGVLSAVVLLVALNATGATLLSAESVVAVGAVWWLIAPFGAIGRTLLYADTRLRKGDRLQPLPS
jgi:hypothetical protein